MYERVHDCGIGDVPLINFPNIASTTSMSSSWKFQTRTIDDGRLYHHDRNKHIDTRCRRNPVRRVLGVGHLVLFVFLIHGGVGTVGGRGGGFATVRRPLDVPQLAGTICSSPRHAV